MASAHRILIIRTDRMGDLLLSLPVVSSLRKAFPEALISLLLQKELEPLFKGHPDLHQLLAFSSKTKQGFRAAWRWAAELRRFQFDAVFVLNPTRLFHLASFLAGIPIRIGYRRKWGFLLTHSIPDTKGQRCLHEVEYNLELVRLLGVDHFVKEFQLPLRTKEHSEALALLARHGIEAPDRPIAIHPWTSNPAKGWPLDSFRDVAGQLQAQGQKVLIIGEPSGEIPMETPFSPGTIDLSRQIPLGILPEILRNCSVLISNDSGPVHVAAAVGTPAVVVAPSEHARQLERWRPLGDQHQILMDPDALEVVQAVRQRLGQNLLR